jgi:hypothetical protein
MSRYSAKQRRMRGIGGRSKRQFIRFFSNVKRSRAYHSLSRTARALLLEMLDRYTGINNGMIGLGVREAKYELRCSHGTVVNAMREIDDAGLAYPAKLGSRLGKKATEWRLTFLRCDLTGDSPRTEWEQRPRFCEVSHGNAKGQPEEHSGQMRSATKPQNGNSSMNDPSVRSATVTHIDIYQGTTGAGNAPTGEVDGDDSTQSSGSKKGLQNNFGPRRRAS